MSCRNCLSVTAVSLVLGMLLLVARQGRAERPTQDPKAEEIKALREALIRARLDAQLLKEHFELELREKDVVIRILKMQLVNMKDGGEAERPKMAFVVELNRTIERLKKELQERDQLIELQQQAIELHRQAQRLRVAEMRKGLLKEIHEIRQGITAVQEEIVQIRATVASGTGQKTQESEKVHKLKAQMEQVVREAETAIRELHLRLAAERDKNETLLKQMTKLRELLATESEKNETLVKQLSKIRELTKTAPDSGSASKELENLNPVQGRVQGTVSKIEAETKFILISIGTDAGVRFNAVLDVYRLRPRPQYLGKLRIVEASNDNAVGRMLPGPGGSTPQILIGDVVGNLRPATPEAKTP